MISRTFHAAIDEWLRSSSWHGGHSSDDECFHKMLAVAESEGPSSFDVKAFAQVVTELAMRHHPLVRASFVADEAHKKALLAEAILGYLAFRDR